MPIVGGAQDISEWLSCATTRRAVKIEHVDDTRPDEPAFRRATEADWPAISALLTASQLPLDGAREALAAFRVVEQNGRIVACAAAERYGDAALLRSVAVAPAQRGHGVGALLVERVMRELAETGCARVVLLTTTAGDWFPRFGFRRIPRDAAPDAVRESVEFRSACPASAVTMLAMLG